MKYLIILLLFPFVAGAQTMSNPIGIMTIDTRKVTQIDTLTLPDSGRRITVYNRNNFDTSLYNIICSKLPEGLHKACQHDKSLPLPAIDIRAYGEDNTPALNKMIEQAACEHIWVQEYTQAVTFGIPIVCIICLKRDVRQNKVTLNSGTGTISLPSNSTYLMQQQATSIHKENFTR